MKMQKIGFLVAGFSALLAATPAFAAWPNSVVGTWSVTANQSTLALVVTSQASTGACRAIAGTLDDVPSGQDSTIQGFYCPGTGRIQFLRINADGATFQVYTGNLAGSGATQRMAGTFAQDDPVAALGEYAFSADK